MKQLSDKFKQPHEVGLTAGGWCGEMYAKIPIGWILQLPQSYSGNAMVCILDRLDDDDAQDASLIEFEFDEGRESDSFELANALANGGFNLDGWIASKKPTTVAPILPPLSARN